MNTNLRAKLSSFLQELQPRKEENTRTNTKRSKLGTSLKAGFVSMMFLVLGYQICLFVQRATVLRIQTMRDHPDTVYVYLSGDGRPTSAVTPQPAPPENRLASLRPHPSGPPSYDAEGGTGFLGGPAAGKSESHAQEIVRTERHNAEHKPAVEAVRKATRRVESFRFNPNTVSVEELQRLGFSEKQALSIEAYRAKGGRFHRPEDFSKSYVVSDSVFRRLRPFIDLPRLDINTADSAAFDALPGIGPYFASKMVWWRGQLGGYSSVEQLTDIYNFTPEKLDALRDLIFCSDPKRVDIWSMTEDELAAHPYIRRRSTAHSIVLYREHHSSDQLTPEGMLAAGIIDEQTCTRLSHLMPE